MFEIKCSDGGKTAMVPFKPRAGKPAYCKTCFSKHRFTPSESGSKTKGFDLEQAWARRRETTQGKKQLNSRLYSNGLTANKTKKLFRKNEARNEVVADFHRAVDSRKFFSGLIQLLFLMPDHVLLS